MKRLKITIHKLSKTMNFFLVYCLAAFWEHAPEKENNPK